MILNILIFSKITANNNERVTWPKIILLRYQYPVDLFNSFVARLRLADKHLIDKGSTEDHD